MNAGPPQAVELRGTAPRELAQNQKLDEGSSSDPVRVEVLADYLGIAPRLVLDMARDGRVVRVSPGRYDLQASIRAYCAHLRNVASARGESGTGGQLTAERTRLVREQADALALKAAAMRGELIPAEDAERRWSEILRGVRGRMLAVPARCQQRIGALTAHDVAAIDREIRDALTEAANDESAF